MKNIVMGPLWKTPMTHPGHLLIPIRYPRLRQKNISWGICGRSGGAEAGTSLSSFPLNQGQAFPVSATCRWVLFHPEPRVPDNHSR
jgi:hypothetical protein